MGKTFLIQDQMYLVSQVLYQLIARKLLLTLKKNSDQGIGYGTWTWQAEKGRTRNTDFYHLSIKAREQNGLKPFALYTLYTGSEKFDGGWKEMSGDSESVACEVIN